MIHQHTKLKVSLLSIASFIAIIGGFAAHASASPRLLHGDHHKVCTSDTAPGIHCFAQLVTDKSGTPASSPLPAGYGPAQFHTAYQLPTTSSKPGTIAVVDAYDDPTITTDLATYDQTFGLPVFPNCSATVTAACLSKVNQNGGSTYPSRSSSWALETSLDVETAHQICQNCKIILVEASSASYNNLMTAIDRARLLGATVISNSYGSSEFSSEISYDSHFNIPGVAFIFSSGDNGYGSSYPAASPYVTSVGGTTLTLTAANNWQTETVWSGTGSGCSKYESRPFFQTNSACANRTIADVAADADPNTGAAVYDSYGYGGHRGWFQVGGTSLAAPIIAGTYGLANDITATTYANAVPYANLNYSLNLRDILTGTNGSCGTVICTADIGYDGPSGLGAPIGLGAF